MKKVWAEDMCDRFDYRLGWTEGQKMHRLLSLVKGGVAFAIFGFGSVITRGLCPLERTCWLKVLTELNFFLGKEMGTCTRCM